MNSFGGRFLAAALAVALFFCGGALALTLQQIKKIYESKLGQVGSYHLQYHVSSEWKKSGQMTAKHLQSHQLLRSKGGYRLEIASENNERNMLVPLKIETDDREQFRCLSFTNDGNPNVGLISPPNTPVTAYDKTLYSPIGLAGLQDSATCGGVGVTNNFLSDIRALAQHPRSKLVEEQVVLDGERAYVIEWPTEAPHPRERVWLSADKNLALLRYESYITNDSGEYKVFVQTTNTDFTEVSPGLFLPRRSEFRRVDELDELPVNNTQVMIIDAISFDVGIEVTPEDLRVNFPDGVHVNDQITGVKYIVGSHESLKTVLNDDTMKMEKTLTDGLPRNIVAKLSALVSALFEGEEQSRGQTWLLSAWVVIPVFLALATLAAILLLIRARKRG